MVSARVNIAILIAVALLCLCAGFFFYPFGSGGAKEAAKKTMCLSNLKQMGSAMELYVSDHNDCYPSQNGTTLSSPISKSSSRRVIPSRCLLARPFLARGRFQVQSGVMR